MSSVHTFFGGPEVSRDNGPPNGAGRGHMSSHDSAFTLNHRPGQEAAQLATGGTGDTFSPQSEGVEGTSICDGTDCQGHVVDGTPIRIDANDPLLEVSGDGMEADPVADIMESWTGISGALPDKAPDGHGQDGEAEPGKAIGAAATSLRETPTALRTDTHAPPADGEALATSHKNTSLQVLKAPESHVFADGTLSSLTSQIAVARDPAEMAAYRLPAQQGNAAMQQVAEALVRMQGDRLDIALSPEELGHLRLIVSRQNGLPHILVWAERPEVLELMRRNADLLQEHFRDEGGDSPSLTFSNDNPDDEANMAKAAESSGERSDPSPSVTALSVTAGGFHRLTDDRRIDIRV